MFKIKRINKKMKNNQQITLNNYQQTKVKNHKKMKIIKVFRMMMKNKLNIRICHQINHLIMIVRKVLLSWEQILNFKTMIVIVNKKIY